MKRVLFIVNNWLTDSGGRKVATTKIVNYLSRNNFDVTVAEFEVGIKPVSRHEIKKKAGFYNKVHQFTYFIRSNDKLLPDLENISNTSNFDIVVCVGSSYFNIVTILAIKMKGFFKNAKIVLFCHTHPFRSIRFSSIPFKNFIYHLGYYFLSFFTYGFFDMIVTPGTALQDFFITKLRIKTEKTAAINNPIFEDRINKKVSMIKWSSILPKLGNKKIIITASRLTLFEKDFQTLFKAIKEVNSKIPCQLVILGEGVDKEKIIKMAEELGANQHVSLIGFKKNPIEYISQAQVFVLSSYVEGSPIILVEAMISKVPIVSSDCDFGPKEILENGKNGILVPVGDHRSMAKAILKVLSDNKLSKKLVHNSQKMIRFYSEDRSFALWNQLLTDL